MKRTSVDKSKYFRQKTSFLDLNIKGIGNNTGIHTSVYGKRDDFGFPIGNFPWLSGDVPRLQSYGICISQLVRFAKCCTSVFHFILKIFKSLQNYWYRVTDITSFGKCLESSLGHTLNFCPNLVQYRFQEYVSKGIAHPVFYGDLVYKLRRVKSETNFISSGWKIVKRIRRRQYDPVIIERTIGLVRGPFATLYRSFLKRCTLTNKAVGTIWRALYKPPQRRQGPGASFTKGRRFRRRRRRKRRLYDKSYAHVRCVLRRGVSPLVTRAYT